MDDITAKLQEMGNPMEGQDKLNVLTSDFEKLEEGQKDFIRELTRKLAVIHCGAEHGGTVFHEAVSPFQI